MITDNYTKIRKFGYRKHLSFSRKAVFPIILIIILMFSNLSILTSCIIPAFAQEDLPDGTSEFFDEADNLLSPGSVTGGEILSGDNSDKDEVEDPASGASSSIPGYSLPPMSDTEEEALDDDDSDLSAPDKALFAAFATSSFASEEYFLVSYIFPDNTVVYASVPASGKAVPLSVTPSDYYASYFRGWFLDSNAWEGDKPFDFNTPVNSDLTLYALCGNGNLITFKDQSGVVLYSYTLAPGTPVQQPSAAITDMLTPPPGTVFLYWYEINDTYSPPEPTDFSNLFANYDMCFMPYFSSCCIVQFMSVGSPTILQFVTVGEYATEPSAPVREGYTFVGWTEYSMPFDFNTPIYGDTTLTAEWQAEEVNYTIAVWLEKANMFSTGYSPAPGKMSQYSFAGSVQGTALAGSYTGFTNLSSLPSEVQDWFSNTAGNGNVLKYADYQAVGNAEILGDGSTVINVFAKRKVYTYNFTLGSGGTGNNNTNDWYYTVNDDPTKYGNGASSYPIYTFQAKFEQDITQKWPSGAGVNFYLNPVSNPGTANVMTGPDNKYSYWGTEPVGQLSQSIFSVKYMTIDQSLIPASGNNSAPVSFTLKTVSTVASYYTCLYFVEVLPGSSPSTPVITYNGKDYVEIKQYAQVSTAVVPYPRSISGFTVIGDKPKLYTSSGGSYTYVGECNTGTTTDELNLNNIRVFLYDRNAYTLSFSGSAPGPIQNMPANRNISFGASLGGEPDIVPQREGYVFTGWYDDSYCTVHFDFSGVMPAWNLQAFAGWEPIKYTVSFYSSYDFSKENLFDIQYVANGGYAVKKANNPEYYEIGATYIGKGIFAGWAYDYEINGTTVSVMYSFDMPVCDNIVVYALWQQTGYHVTYDLDGGVGTLPIDLSIYLPGSATKLMTTDAVKDGQYFISWRWKDKIVYPGDILTVNENMYFIACYSPVVDLYRTVQYVVEGKAPVSFTPVIPATASWLDGSVVTVADDLTTTEGSMDGIEGVWVFNGWWSDDTDISEENGRFTVDKNVTIKGSWAFTPYVFCSVIYNANGGTGAPTDDSNPYKSGSSVAVLGPGSMRRDSYTFVGWAVTAAGSVTYTPGQTFTILNDTTLYAVWQKNPELYKVTYYGNGNTGGDAPVDDSSYLSGAIASVLGQNTLIRTGWTFRGWAVSSDGPVSFTAGNTITVTGNIALYAVWTFNAATRYTVTYLPGSHGTFAPAITSGLSLGDITPAGPLPATGESGWTFTGWNPEVSPVVRGSAEYTAQWEQTVLTVRFVDWDGRLISTQQVAYGDDAIAPTSPERAEYIFTGWDLPYTNITSDLTITAQYQPVTPGGPGNNPDPGRPDPPDEPSPEEVLDNIIKDGVPILNIGGLEIPLSPGSMNKYVWALLNLILAIAGGLIAILTALRTLIQKNRDDEEDEYQNYRYESEKDEYRAEKRRKRVLLIVLTILTGIAGIVVFMLTEDITRLMVLIDHWTILNLILFIANLLSCIFSFRRRKDQDDLQENNLPA